jgi:tRNA(Arg) A34 adenosine deaminase TadA
MTELSATDERLLRRSIEVSAAAVASGNMPFGAILADPDGNILLEAENTGITGRNTLNHAETNLMNMAVTTLTPSEIASATLYTSCEPCAMCAGAMYWGGLNRMVYAMSELDLLEITSADPADQNMRGVGCRNIFDTGQRHIEVLGPHLVEEASAVHIAFWASGGPQDPTLELSPQDEALLRRAIEVATRSVTNGNLPFGALLADPDGNVLLEAENTDLTGRSTLNHAETNLMRMAVDSLTSEQIATATFYTSCEPCAMCSGSMYWGGLNRMVYGMGEHHLLEITGAHALNPTMRGVGCRSVLHSGQRRIEVSGPHLIEECSEIHRTYWST